MPLTRLGSLKALEVRSELRLGLSGTSVLCKCPVAICDRIATCQVKKVDCGTKFSRLR